MVKTKKGIDILQFIELPVSIFNSQNVLPLYKEEDNQTITVAAWDRVHQKSVNGYVKITVKKDGYFTNGFGPFEEDVLIGLLELTNQRGWESRKIKFESLSELMKYVGWGRNGTNLSRLADCLINLKHIIVETNLFWDSEKKVFQKRYVDILSELGFDQADRYGRPVSASKVGGYFEWGETLFKEVDRKQVKSLDTHVYRSIKNHAARKLYRVIDKRSYKDSIVGIPLDYLALSILRMKQSEQWYYRRQISSYADELKRVGYIAQLQFQMRYGIEYAFFVLDRHKSFELENVKPDIDPLTADYEKVLEAMMLLGFREKSARMLLLEADLTYVAEWVDCLSKGLALEQGSVANVPAFLTDAIRSRPRWDLPKRYYDFINNERLKKEKLDRAETKKALIEGCAICDQAGYRYEKYKNMGDETIVVKIQCDHQPPLFAEGREAATHEEYRTAYFNRS